MQIIKLKKEHTIAAITPSLRDALHHPSEQEVQPAGQLFHEP
jgi:hypothetical protein